MCVCANHALEGHGEKAVDRMGRGRSQDKAPSPQGEEGAVAEDSRGHPLGYSQVPARKPKESIVAIRTRLRWEPRNLRVLGLVLPLTSWVTPF